jgi:hypothetical protein
MTGMALHHERMAGNHGLVVTGFCLQNDLHVSVQTKLVDFWAVVPGKSGSRRDDIAGLVGVHLEI